MDAASPPTALAASYQHSLWEETKALKLDQLWCWFYSSSCILCISSMNICLCGAIWFNILPFFCCSLYGGFVCIGVCVCVMPSDERCVIQSPIPPFFCHTRSGGEPVIVPCLLSYQRMITLAVCKKYIQQ